ncbi:MAG: DUF2339 domain-containing protein, partial [Alphaproteobacteria bacterium]
MNSALTRIAKMVDEQAAEIAHLRERIAQLTGETPDTAQPPASSEPPETSIATSTTRPLEQAPPATISEPPGEPADTPKLDETPAPPPPPVEPAFAARPGGTVPPTPPVSPAPRPSFWDKLKEGGLERQFGAVLPVWIGGIALAFAGFFLVKYSIDNNLMGPEVRVSLGGIFGALLLIAARYVSTKTTQEGNYRIAQALAGAGIAVLYVSFYAATMMYALLTPFWGFAGMAATTVLAVILALRHGPPIALMGMVGGFLTPALIQSGHPSAIMLFAYLYFVFAALMIIVRREGWWLLALPALIFAFFWVLAWVFWVPHNPGETMWVSMFVIAIAGTIVAATRQRYAEETDEFTSWQAMFSLKNRASLLNVISLAGAFLVIAVMAFNIEFSLYDWGVFAILALGGIGLAYFDTPRYGFVPWAAMAVNAAMLVGWSPADVQNFTFVVAAFGALYAVSGFMLLPRGAYPLLWAGLSGASSLGYYLLAYFRIHNYPPMPISATSPVPPTATPAPPAEALPPIAQPITPVEPLVEDLQAAAEAITHVWSSIAMVLALVFLGAAMWSAKRFPESWAKERVLAIFTLATTAFLAIALSIELQREFLSVAIAAELLAVAWVATKTRIASLRPIAGLLGGAFAYLLLPQILLFVKLALAAVFDFDMSLPVDMPISAYPAFQLGLPAVFFLLAAYLFRMERDGKLVYALELAALALIALMGHYTTAHLFHPGESVMSIQRTYLEHGIMTNVMFAFGLGCLVIARLYGRRAFGMVGVALAGIALFRTGYFGLLINNPVWEPLEVAGIPLVNALAVTFLLPIGWVWLTAREFAATEYERLTRLAKQAPMIMLALVFVWVNFEVRRFYQGSFLDSYSTSDAEFYTYSVAWLVFGLVLLFMGTLRGNQMMRYVSL